MRKVLKISAWVLVVIIIGTVSTCFVVSKKKPVVETGIKAEELADNMWKSLNKVAWDSTQYVKWSFRGKHHYMWDKKSNLADIRWSSYRVLLNPDKVDGVVYEKDKKLEGKAADKVIQKAWGYWCNDMYWLAAPFKIRDKGTSLGISNEGALVVSYASGGVTPGDTYVWKLDNNAMPVSYEMFVSIIPVKGLAATWQKFTAISTGALLATEHKIVGTTLDLSPISGGNNLSDIGLDQDVWKEIRE